MKKIILVFLLFILASCTPVDTETSVNLTPSDSSTSPSTILSESTTTDKQAQEWYESGVEKIVPYSGTLTYNLVEYYDDSSEYYDTAEDSSFEVSYSFSGDKVYYTWEDGYTLYVKKIDGQAIYQYVKDEFYNPTGEDFERKVTPTTGHFSVNLDKPLIIGRLYGNGEYEFKITPGFYDPKQVSFDVIETIEYEDGSTEIRKYPMSFLVLGVGGGTETECPSLSDNFITSPSSCIYTSTTDSLEGSFTDSFFAEGSGSSRSSSNVKIDWLIS
ncbi:MAG: hypothetical protein WC254_00290 [Candidatus Woesearchaeota archaeon]|jgi:hypothetical protein